MKTTTVNKVGLAGIVGGGLIAAVLGLAAPAQADVGHHAWAAQQNPSARVSAPAGFPHAQMLLTSVVGSNPDPLVPYGTNPQVQTPIGLQSSNHDEVDTTSGQVDLPF